MQADEFTNEWVLGLCEWEQKLNECGFMIYREIFMLLLFYCENIRIFKEYENSLTTTKAGKE